MVVSIRADVSLSFLEKLEFLRGKNYVVMHFAGVIPNISRGACKEYMPSRNGEHDSCYVQQPETFDDFFTDPQTAALFSFKGERELGAKALLCVKRLITCIKKCYIFLYTTIGHVENNMQ